MDHEQAADVLRQLADGLDPRNGEAFPDDSPYQHPRVIRALFVANAALADALARARRSKDLPEHAGEPWSDEEDRRLVEAFDAGTPPGELAARHKRTTSAIDARLARLGKIAPGATGFRV